MVNELAQIPDSVREHQDHPRMPITTTMKKWLATNVHKANLIKIGKIEITIVMVTDTVQYMDGVVEIQDDW